MSFGDRDIQRFLEMASERLDRGEHRQAINYLQQALAIDPDHAFAHGLLSIALIHAKRLHAAEAEARIALTLDTDEPLAYRALGAVLVAQKKWKEAEPHLVHAVELEPEEPAGHRSLAMLYSLSGRRDEALAALQHARELAPNDPSVLADLGELHLERGEMMLAERFAREALDQDSGHPDALVVMGYVELKRNHTQLAREHAVWVLHDRPDDHQALSLLAAVKARESKVLGLWWRWNTWMREMGDTRSTLVLLVAFAIYRAATILLEGTEYDRFAGMVTLVWLGAVVYTWVAPGMYQKMLEKELESVRLRPDF